MAGIIGVQGQLHDERRAGALRALRLSDGRHAGSARAWLAPVQTPVPPMRAAVRNVDPVKPFGEPRQMFGSDAGAVVAHRYARFRYTAPRVSTRQRHVDALTGSTVLESVFDKVFKHTDELVTIAKHDQRVL